MINSIYTVLIDFDGVLTDGKKYYSSTGEMFLSTHSRDNSAISELVSRGLNVIILTANSSTIIEDYANRLKIKLVVLRDKIGIISQGVKLSNTIFIGDDTSDLMLMKLVKIPLCPSDAHEEVKKYVASKSKVINCKGGHGVISEFVRKIWAAKNEND